MKFRLTLILSIISCAISIFAQENWHTQNSGTNRELTGVYFVDENISPGQYQYRLKQIDYYGSFEYSDIVDINISGPTKFSLEQNYPNPFNPSTTIQYSIPESGNVKLLVYNSLGEVVANPVNGYKTAGTYRINFNASELSSGIYYYKIISGNFTSVKKMALLK